MKQMKHKRDRDTQLHMSKQKQKQPNNQKKKNKPPKTKNPTLFTTGLSPRWREATESGRKENQLYLSSSGGSGPNLSLISSPVPLWVIWKWATLFCKWLCVCALFLLWLWLFPSHFSSLAVSALSQSLSRIEVSILQARGELVWISPDPTCSPRNVSFESSNYSTLMPWPWFWFKNWRTFFFGPREV